MTIPKLQTENLNAAMAVIEYLKRNPGSVQVDMRKVIDRNKRVLKNGYFGFPYNGKAHYMNYQNIETYLIFMRLAKKVRDEVNNVVRWYAI